MLISKQGGLSNFLLNINITEHNSGIVNTFSKKYAIFSLFFIL